GRLGTRRRRKSRQRESRPARAGPADPVPDQWVAMSAVTVGRKGGAMASRRVASVAVMAALVGQLGLGGGPDGAALVVCTAAQISGAPGNDSGCPTGTGACTITKDFTITDGCTIDFGTRAVTVNNGKELTVGGGTVIFKMGSLDLKPGAIINARGENS